MQSGNNRPRRVTANYGNNYIDTNSVKKNIKFKASSNMSVKNILQKTYKNAEATVSGSKASLSNENNNIEITEAETANMEFLLDENNLLNINKNNFEKGKEKEAEENATNQNDATNNTNKENEATDNITKEVIEISDNISEASVESFKSEHEEWRLSIQMQKYKAWIKTVEVKGKNLSEKVDYISNLMGKKIITIKTEKNRDDKQMYIAVYFEKKEDMENACKMEIDGNKEGDRSTLKRTATNQNRTINNKNGVKFWDIPLGMQEQEFKGMIKNKFGNVTSCSMSTRGMWSSAIVHFEKPDTAAEILSEWSQIVGEESCRVTNPECTFAQLKERGSCAVKIINLPPDVTARELYKIISPLGAKTCYFPRNLYGKKKRMAIASVESEEGKNQLVGQAWQAGQFLAKIVDTTTKTCHRCHADDHLVSDCPIAQKQKEISERKARDFERFGHLYKKQRPQLYRSLAPKVDLGTKYADAVKRKGNTKQIQPIEDEASINIMQILKEMQQDMQYLKNQVIEINERLDLLETHVIHQVLNDEEVEEMETSDEENEENIVDNTEQKTNKGDKTQEIYNLLTTMGATLRELKLTNTKTQERLDGLEGKKLRNEEQNKGTDLV